MQWSVPPLWKDGTCWIIGGGPSMPRQFNIPENVIQDVMHRRSSPAAYSPYLEALHNRHIIGVNNVYQIGEWIDTLFFGDCSWYVVHRLALAKWPKLKVTCCNRFSAKPSAKSNGILYLAKDRRKKYGISANPTTVAWNNNSGAAAISLAVHFGVKKIFLLGFDMSLDSDKVSHWHGSHAGNSNSKKKFYSPPFARHLRGFPEIAADAVNLGVEIVNCSPNSAIQEFRKCTVNEILGNT